jgi:NAD(P)H-dependent FMN reductase
MKILVISASLNSGSKSRILAVKATICLEAMGIENEILDMESYQLPMTGTDDYWKNADVLLVKKIINSAQGILLSAPIYTYDLSAAAKNLIELTGEGWNGKVVGFLCAAGGAKSYMSVMPFMNSLMLDHRCLIIPRFVYAESGDWDGMTLKNKEIDLRIEELVAEVSRVTGALNQKILV